MRRELERKEIEQQREDKRLLERQKKLADLKEEIRKERYMQEKLLWKIECRLKLKLQRKS